MSNENVSCKKYGDRRLAPAGTISEGSGNSCNCSYGQCKAEQVKCMEDIHAEGQNAAGGRRLLTEDMPQ